MYFTIEKVNELRQITEGYDRNFRGQHTYYRRFLAVNDFKSHRTTDLEKVKIVMKYIKKNTGLFSPFRSSAFTVSALLVQNYKKPEEAFDRLVKHYELLKANGFRRTTFLPMLSYTMDALMFDDKIQDMAIQTESYRQTLAEKGMAVYQRMKVNHPWLTGGDDYPLALLIAHNDKDIDRVESIYQKLHDEGLKKGNNLQGLANIAGLSDMDEQTMVDRVMEVKNKLGEEGLKVNQSMYEGVGLLSIVTEKEEYFSQVVEVTKELKKLKGYKMIDRSLLFLFAVTIVSEDIKHELSTKTIAETTLTITIEQLVMAQTAVMIAVMSSTTAAISTSS